ncbi:MAG TPA: 50S ribosomal protein L17 [Myxococcota bacterium]|jgi:large subunit ribosomal protein L17
MKHRMHTRHLGRSSPHRKALMRNMVTSLLEHERIETTDAKAKELRRVADRMITLGKRGTLHARRRALRTIRSRDIAAKLFDSLALRYRDRAGGYTRILKLGHRAGDAAPISIIELVDREVAAAAPKRGVAAPKGAPARKAGSAEKAAAAKAKPAKPAAKPAAAKKRSAKPAADAKGKARKASPRKRGSTKSPG